MMDDWTLWIIAAALLLILIGRTIPLAVEEIKLDIARRKAKRGDPIDWTGDHNLKLPVAPYFDPRVEFTEEEAFLDLLEENARLLREIEEVKALRAEVERQENLKRRYLRELKRVRG